MMFSQQIPVCVETSNKSAPVLDIVEHKTLSLLPFFYLT